MEMYYNLRESVPDTEAIKGLIKNNYCKDINNVVLNKIGGSFLYLVYTDSEKCCLNTILKNCRIEHLIIIVLTMCRSICSREILMYPSQLEQ